MIKILFLVSSLNIGDLNQKDAILSALSSIEPIEITIDASAPNAKNIFLTQAPKNEKYITVAVGDHGQNLLIELKNDIDKRNNYVVLSTHQYTDKIKELSQDKTINHIALPEVTLNSISKNSIEGINQSLLFAVPTKNPTLIELEHSYNNWRDENKPKIDNNYIIVMLPGDIIAPNGSVSLFSEASANKLFNNIEKLWLDNGKKHKIIVQNSPRTGKYDIRGNIIGAHQYENKKVDHISTEFIKWLDQARIPYSFFNFTFKDGKPNSVYNQLLYLATIDGNYFITPAGSISMMSQIPFYIPGNRNIIFKPDSMNQAHADIFSLGLNRQYFSYFLENGDIVSPSSPKLRTDDDAKKLANDIINLL
jgi:hypothetical protein